MRISKEYKDELKRLRSQLDGSYARVASAAGVSIATVSRVLNGKQENTTVVLIANDMAKVVVSEKEAQQNMLMSKLSA